ncbi:hypothetical protein EP10_000058 [Geobacillus icigianus]|uniref:DUF1360 domain-containing protein n=2 Tax=Anoxybacillaceae TaxID=3120669 RepID=A0ABU6BBD6_9BACL|nr:hypothetical protein [Geobacillus icigianus]
MSLMDMFLLVFAAFRLTRLLVYDQITAPLRRPFYEAAEEVGPDGAKEIVWYVRKEPVRRFVGELLSCYWCTGIWSAGFLWLGYVWWPALFQPVCSILAVAALAGLVQWGMDQWEQRRQS